MTAMLDKHLLDFYNEHILHGKPKASSVQSFKVAVQGDAHLAAEAQHRLAELRKLEAATGGQLANRCYVSHVQKLALEEALA